MIYLLLTDYVYVYAFQLLGNSDLKFFIIRYYYYRANIQVHTFALLLLCNPLPVLIHIIVDRNVINSKYNFD